MLVWQITHIYFPIHHTHQERERAEGRKAFWTNKRIYCQKAVLLGFAKDSLVKKSWEKKNNQNNESSFPSPSRHKSGNDLVNQVFNDMMIYMEIILK